MELELIFFEGPLTWPLSMRLWNREAQLIEGASCAGMDAPRRSQDQNCYAQGSQSVWHVCNWRMTMRLRLIAVPKVCIAVVPRSMDLMLVLEEHAQRVL